MEIVSCTHFNFKHYAVFYIACVKNSLNSYKNEFITVLPVIDYLQTRKRAYYRS